ncbi:hypothetical protein HK098_004605 [Nowakowskiella sp. JEL0407]|nr:hypothetical protein HK098_004605 [Nowakowskiella sp. JEL0407]
MKHVITIEGLGSTKTGLHPIQQKIAESHGSQCGFCTPGIVMSLFGLMTSKGEVGEHDIEEAFDGNLCRCTGYRPILEGARSFATTKHKSCTGDCSKDGSECKKEACENYTGDIEDMGANQKNMPSLKTLEFPQELISHYHSNPEPQSYSFDNGVGKWFHPSSVSEFLEILDKYPQAKIVGGNTELGIEIRFKNLKYPVFIHNADILDLQTLNITEMGVEIGSAVTLSNLQNFLAEVCADVANEHKHQNFAAILSNLKYFAGTQIRNVAAIAGNIVTASPISDLNPVLVAAGATLTIQSVSGTRTLPIRDFFIGYRKTALAPGEAIISIFVPFTVELEYVKAYKQAKRRDDDIAIVNSCIKVAFTQTEEGFVVKDATLAFGGMAPTTVVAKKSSASLVGKVWNDQLIDEISSLLLEDMPMSFDTPGGQVEYRKTLAMSFFAKFFLQTCHALSLKNETYAITKRDESILSDFEREISRGSQVIQEASKGDIVGESVMHRSATKQVTGEALYIDDIPKYANELYGSFVMSSEAHAKILNVDYSEALAYPDVVDYISAKDVPHWNASMKFDDAHNPNVIGPTFKDEELFATDEVFFFGQPIGMIVAESHAAAIQASKLVKVQYEKLPTIFTIEEAIEAESFFPISKTITCGKFATDAQANPELDSDVPLEAATQHITGSMRIAAQEHFYLETQASLAVPKGEDDEIEIFASTQNPTETQHLVAHVLGIPANRVNCKVKRLGGGFGGKETRSVFLSCAVAVAAKKLEKPVRYMLSREEDMLLSGMRHPFLGNYCVGFTDEGKLVSLELDLFANGGYSMDLSLPVVERAMTHSDNVYKIPNVRITGKICKTNLTSNTAYRGFGGPQGMMVAEAWINHVADYLNKPVNEIRELNFYTLNDYTHFRQPLDDFHWERCWKEMMEISNFSQREAEIEVFNKENKYRKKGIVAMPTKFGLAFTFRAYNQAGALVHVYASDGSVLITHGGTEMGQGLHTKMLQIAAKELGVPLSKVHLSETSTATVANTSPTAASLSSDINGMAVKIACEQIAERLKPYREKNPDATWEQIVGEAYLDRVNLSANGFYKVPDLTYDWTTNSGRMFGYFTYGAAVTEVEIDTLTGDHVALKTDIVFDIGTSINPAIDIGQIEGAFAQGQGWSTIEEPLISPKTGILLTRGPGAYKIPGFRDIPVEFNVRVVAGSRNSRAIHSSKAVGEPPLFLGASVFWAIRNAVKHARTEHGLKGYFDMMCPATSEKIRLTCQDFIAVKSETEKGALKSWSCIA